MEVTFWPCEGSTRQEWKLNEKKQIQVFGHDWLGNPTSSCIANQPDESFKGLVLTNCDDEYGNPAYFDLELEEENDEVQFVLLLEGDKSCLVLRPLENEGGAYGELGGAQLGIGDCDQDAVCNTFIFIQIPFYFCRILH